MSTRVTRNFLDLAEACVILAKYNSGSHTIMPDSKDVMYAQVNPNQLTTEDRERLNELGWYVDPGLCSCMAWGTGRFAHLYNEYGELIGGSVENKNH